MVSFTPAPLQALPPSRKKQKGHPKGYPLCLVRATGLEPAQPCDHKNLNLTRLPIPPRPHIGSPFGERCYYNTTKSACQEGFFFFYCLFLQTRKRCEKYAKQQTVDKNARKSYNRVATQLHIKAHLRENILVKGVFPLFLYRKWEGNCVATNGGHSLFRCALVGALFCLLKPVFLHINVLFTRFHISLIDKGQQIVYNRIVGDKKLKGHTT